VTEVIKVTKLNGQEKSYKIAITGLGRLLTDIKSTETASSSYFQVLATLRVAAQYSLFLPAASQCLVQLNDSEQFIEPCLHQPKLGRKGVGFVSQDFQISRDATVVAHV
jgi:hypothetical protein